MIEQTSAEKRVLIYTDGGCRPNPGPGAWAAILRFGDEEKILVGSQPHATNNQMEIQAVVEALRALPAASQVSVFTDSQYLQRGVTEWLPVWRRNNWRAANRRPVKNRALWETLVAAAEPHDIRWRWIAGHNQHFYNERADRLVRQQLRYP